MQAVKWGEYKITSIFDVRNTHSILSCDVIPDSGNVPYLCASSENNAVSSYISYDDKLIDEGNCIFIGGKTFVVSYQEKDFYSNDSHNLALYLKDSDKRTKSVQVFMTSCISSSLCNKYSWGNSISHKKIEDDVVQLPQTADGKIDFDFMESFIRELEEERIRELSAYLTVSGLSDTKLSDSEEAVLLHFKGFQWKEFKVEALFGKSTRGKRLKSADRIEGDLPFVTAGEADEGISAFISNNVEVFSKNTTTIDMFGSAKYRNYDYGADDHVAVVHTENLAKYAAIFITTSCHKSAHNGQFNYGHNFYAKDADSLNIMLPVKSDSPDYDTMETFISAVQKLVIKDVVQYANKKIEATKKMTKTGSQTYGELKIAEQEPPYGEKHGK